MGAMETCGTPPAAAARRRHGVLPGQAYIFIALALPVLCGMLALAVDVGTTTARYQALQHSAENAAEAGAYALYGSRIGATTSLTDTGVWNAMASKLTAQGLSVMNAPGGSVPRDPCAAGYLTNQVAMTATYLDATDSVITTTGTTPWVVGSGSIPLLARGVSVTLGGCQPAGFGGVLGHPTYTIWVNGSAGRWLPGPNYTPTPGTGPAHTIPYAISAAPYGDCSNTQYPSPSTTNYPPTVPLRGGGTTSPDQNDPVQFYCRGVYTIGSTVSLYADGGVYNDWASDASFKGYIGGASTIGTENWVPAGHGNNAPSCPLPSQVTVPIITYVHHTGNTEYFVILETVVVNTDPTHCGNTGTLGTIASVKDDSYGYGVVSIPPPVPAPTNTPVAVGFRAAATAGTTGQTTSLTISVPASIQNNDVLIAQVAIQTDTVPITAPSGWTQIRLDQNSGGGIMQGLYYHVVTSPEPASYTWTWAGSGSNASGGMAAYEGVDTSNPINASSGAASSSTSNTIVAPSLTTTVGNTEVLSFFGARSNSAVTVPTNLTPRWSAQSTTGSSSSQYSSSAEGDTLQAAVGATGAFTATISDTQNNVGQVVALQPIGIVPLPTATITPTPLPTDTPPPLPTYAPPVIHGAL
jgi:hypothetical protein